ncbi:toxin [Streptomyces sp. H39-S7]|uniref:toxin n=1 Tax=Streptomyces sp. H39-S7 TaxID=3004357 RepID=UPI0022AE545E|nr:toxin [Streptomyces sp. H39-S7]MCZ4123660.1 toxin [Streptomyces sp. H39-S7]
MRRRSRRTGRAGVPAPAQSIQGACRTFVRSLDLPCVHGVRELTDYIERLIGEPIIISPSLSADGRTPCGLLVKIDGVNHIGYDPSTSSSHQDDIIAHEFGHLLKGHAGGQVTPASAAGIILGDIDPDLIQMVLCRARYDDKQELEAEIIGTYLQAHVRRSSGAPATQGPDGDRILQTLIRRKNNPQ